MVVDKHFGLWAPYSEIQGRKWKDLNFNEKADAGEPGLAGWTIYVDLNENGQWDSSEPSTVTVADDPTTTNIDETGNYRISGLIPGRIRFERLRNRVGRRPFRAFGSPRLKRLERLPCRLITPNALVGFSAESRWPLLGLHHGFRLSSFRSEQYTRCLLAQSPDRFGGTRLRE